MISKELNDWLQVVGLFGILGGLIFVGLQLSQDRRVALSEGVSAASADMKAWAELVNDNAEVWVKGSSGEPLSAVEAARFESLARARELWYYTEWNRAIQIGTQRPQRWVRGAALEFSSHPGLRKFWTGHKALIDRLSGTESEWSTAVEEEILRLDQESSAGLDQEPR